MGFSSKRPQGGEERRGGEAGRRGREGGGSVFRDAGCRAQDSSKFYDASIQTLSLAVATFLGSGSSCLPKP